MDRDNRNFIKCYTNNFKFQALDMKYSVASTGIEKFGPKTF